MRLTMYTDYSLRTLMYLALQPKDRLSTIQDIADAYNISKNHLMKVTHQLGLLGYIETIRGRGGGIRLHIDPKDINIGQVVRKTEDDFHLVECFSENNLCVVSPQCRLKGMLGQALQAFIQVLDQYTLQDVIENKDMLKPLLNDEST